MDDQRPLDNMEEKRGSNPENEKRTLTNNNEPGGLNDGNPNTNNTPATKVQEAKKEFKTNARD
jgi:hypothetical protein